MNNMTNKKKVLELAKDYAPAIENLDAKIVLYDAIMDMAKWKDIQFKEFLNTLSFQSNIYEVYKLINMYKEELL